MDRSDGPEVNQLVGWLLESTGLHHCKPVLPWAVPAGAEHEREILLLANVVVGPALVPTSRLFWPPSASLPFPSVTPGCGHGTDIISAFPLWGENHLIYCLAFCVSEDVGQADNSLG